MVSVLFLEDGPQMLLNCGALDATLESLNRSLSNIRKLKTRSFLH